MNTTLRTVAAFTIVALVAIANRATGQNMPPTLVETDTVQTLEFHEQITLIGRTEARIQSRIVAEVSGQVAVINAVEGTWIDRGGVLVTIDPEPHRLALAAGEASVAEAEALAALAAGNWERTQKLYDQKLVRDVTRDSVRAALTIAESRHKQLEAQRDQLALNFDNCRVKAPFAGFTGRRLIDVGEWVTPGTPVFEMVDLSKVTVIVSLPERHFGRLSLHSPVKIVASGDEGDPLVGTVTGFSPQATGETHTYPVIITVDNPGDRLGGGAVVRATLSLDQKFTSLAVSKDAIVRQGEQTMVYTIHDGQAAPVPVLITSEQGTMAAVAGEGVVQGMPVVIRGNERIYPGSPVRTADGPPPGAPPAETGSE